MAKKFNLQNKMVAKPEDVMFMPSSPVEEVQEETVSDIKQEETIITEEKPVNSSKQGLKNGETRFTFIADQELVNQFYNIAYWKRLKIKEAAEEMMRLYIEHNKEDALNNKPVRK